MIDRNRYSYDEWLERVIRVWPRVVFIDDDNTVISRKDFITLVSAKSAFDGLGYLGGFAKEDVPLASSLEKGQSWVQIPDDNNDN
jgi:hypothetical protein